MADSQTMRSQQPQPNNGNTQVTIGLNMAYIKSMPAYLKAASVLVGLIAMSLVANAYEEGWYFNFDYSYYCEGFKRVHGRTCPIKLLVTPFVFVLAFTWAGTLIMLIVLAFIDLNKKPPFPQVDFIGHLVAGGLAILSGLCLIGYVVTVFLFDECNEGSSSARHGRKAANKTHSAKSRRLTAGCLSTCKDCQSDKYKHWHVLFGALFAFAAGALYILVALYSKKKGSGGRTLMGMGQGQRQGPKSTTPSQAQMQAQGSPSQQANSVHQSPSTKTGSPSQAAENA